MLRLTRTPTVFSLFVLSLASTSAYAYTSELCEGDPTRYCFVVHGDESWESLWPNPEQREVAMRLNRMNTRLRPGIRLVDPDQLSRSEIEAQTPFPEHLELTSKTIVVDPDNLAWAAYDSHGNFLRWGAASAARGFCSDINSPCVTPTGTYSIYRKGGPECVSKKFPINEGGAPMPHCMFFKDGYAMHGSYQVPGFNASHGCVRIFPQDAAWLNRDFSSSGNTKVVVRAH